MKTYQALEAHKCESSRVANWVIYECPECDYQLWDNLSTGEMKVFNTKIDVDHSGFYKQEPTDSKSGVRR